MRSFTLGISTVLFATATVGQTVDRTITFAHTDDPQNIQEVASLCRTIADIKDVSVDVAQRSMTLHGTADQISVVEWLVKRLDRPLADQQNSDSNETRMPDPRNETVIRLIYLTHNETIQQFQEIATATRTTADVRRVFTYNAPRAMVLRGTPEQIALASWVVGQLDQPLDAPLRHSAAEYREPASSDDVTRVFTLAYAESIQDFQEMATSMRMIADIRRVFTYNERRAVSVRGTADQLAMAQWLMGRLDRPDSARDASLYALPASGDEKVGVYYVSPNMPGPDFQKSAISIRASTGMARVFTHSGRRAIVVRGTSDQLARTELMLGASAR
ncbi:MAG TPA: hypothetical protein VNX18_23445 [Bryobacteraceae bacterium]|nr:hypothetical protein [Bryobacteraceae bacterium]